MEAARDPAAGPRPDAAEEVATRVVRLPAAILASSLAHALVAVLVFSRWPTPVVHPALATIPISLVGRIGGGGGNGAPAAAPAPSPVPAEQPKPAPHPVAHAAPSRQAAVRHPPTHPESPPPPAPGAATEGASAGGAGAGGGSGAGAGREGGDGSGGDGSGGARVAYGTNPLPAYPMVARRLGMEGVVLLDVLVAPDGQAAEVHVARSSGFAALDQSALTTVRDHWRFVPARRDGVPIASRVTVPIRFRLGDPGPVSRAGTRRPLPIRAG